MNLVGKIFIVLILVMSLVFMSFAVAVYATHKNWHDLVMNATESADKPLGLKHKLANEKKLVQERTEERDKLKKTFDEERTSLVAAKTKLETENVELQNQRTLDQKKLDDLTKSQREAIAAMQANQLSQANLRKEVDTLREDVRKTQQETALVRKKMVDQTDELHQAALELKTLRARNKTLVDDLANAREVLKKFSLKDNPKAYDGVPPPELKGVVLATPGSGLIEISVGSDDGLMEKHQLQVYRIADGVSNYLGVVEVIKLAPEKAVCKVLPGVQTGRIQVGDRVAAKLDK